MLQAAPKPIHALGRSSIRESFRHDLPLRSALNPIIANRAHGI
jgi:hypothetical protein